MAGYLNVSRIETVFMTLELTLKNGTFSFIPQLEEMQAGWLTMHGLIKADGKDIPGAFCTNNDVCFTLKNEHCFTLKTDDFVLNDDDLVMKRRDRTAHKSDRFISGSAVGMDEQARPNDYYITNYTRIPSNLWSLFLIFSGILCLLFCCVAD